MHVKGRHFEVTETSIRVFNDELLFDDRDIITTKLEFTITLDPSVPATQHAQPTTVRTYQAQRVSEKFDARSELEKPIETDEQEGKAHIIDKVFAVSVIAALAIYQGVIREEHLANLQETDDAIIISNLILREKPYTLVIRDLKDPETIRIDYLTATLNARGDVV